MKNFIVTLFLLVSVPCFQTIPMIRDAQIKSEAGEPEAMIPVIERALEKGEFVEAAKWIARFKIRVRQDAACCTDKSAIAAMDALTMREWNNPKFGEIAKHISEETYKKIFLDQVEWVEQKLEKDQLPEPLWIAQYGMNKFISALGGEASSEPFIPKSQWKRERQKMLEKYKKGLSTCSKK